MIPDFDHNGNLPPGIHKGTWDEFANRFGWNRHRQQLIQGLRLAVRHLQQAGCRAIYVDGSFVTAKEVPNDYDAVWDIESLDEAVLYRLEPAFFDLDPPRQLQKARYGGEFFPGNFTIEDGDGFAWLDFFGTDREGNLKGIVALDLRRSWP